jgi:hypothetical protein
VESNSKYFPMDEKEVILQKEDGEDERVHGKDSAG